MPWLQDVDADSNGVSDVWYDSWEITYRDVVILDANNDISTVFNVTSNDLGLEANYSTLKNAFLSAIVPNAQSAWQNPIEPLNINDDGAIAPLDALLVINALSEYPDGELPTSIGGSTPYLDPNGDGQVSPIDALLVINQLNANSDINSVMAASSGSTRLTEPDSVAIDLRNSAVRSDTPDAVDAAMAEFADDELGSAQNRLNDLPSQTSTLIDPLATRVADETGDEPNNPFDELLLGNSL